MQMIYALYYNNEIYGMFISKQLARKYRNQIMKSDPLMEKEDFEIQWYYLNKV